MKLYEEASVNSMNALTDLGYIYHHGVKDEENNSLIEPNIEWAKEIYKKGVKEKFPRALNNMAILLLNEKKTNCEEAIKYFENAMNLGYIKAGFNLGLCYEQGKGVALNTEKAISLYKDAASKGDLNAKLFYSYHILKKALLKEDYSEILDSARFLIELTYIDYPNPEVYYYLGLLYENGIKDLNKFF